MQPNPCVSPKNPEQSLNHAGELIKAQPSLSLCLPTAGGPSRAKGPSKGTRDASLAKEKAGSNPSARLRNGCVLVDSSLGSARGTRRPFNVLALNEPWSASELCAHNLTFVARRNVKSKPGSWPPEVFEAIGDLGHGKLLGTVGVEAPDVRQERVVIIQDGDMLSLLMCILLVRLVEVVYYPDGTGSAIRLYLDDSAKTGGDPGSSAGHHFTVGIRPVYRAIGVVVEIIAGEVEGSDLGKREAVLMMDVVRLGALNRVFPRARLLATAVASAKGCAKQLGAPILDRHVEVDAKDMAVEKAGLV